jgi:fructose-1,6-bisphosphatase/inositol monophosphatase family enzyme
MIRRAADLLQQIRSIHEAIRDAVVAACEATPLETLSGIASDAPGDTIYAIDRVSEEVLLEHFHDLAQEWPCILIAEGLGASGSAVLPAGSDPAQAELRIIVDPIDGTRGLMYQKRSAWILTGVAPNRGPATSLRDIELAVQTEIPLVKQHLSDCLWVGAGTGVGGERYNRLTGERRALAPRPSQARTYAHGYGQIVRFFPGTRAELAALDDAVAGATLGPPQPGKAGAFEDQYASTGGQLYELMMGHDRWIADIRPLLAPLVRARGQALGLCCHPYDLCTELIARTAGVLVTDAQGRPLDAPLDVTADVAWIGYANAAIRAQVAPVLTRLLLERGWLPSAEPGDVGV